MSKQKFMGVAMADVQKDKSGGKDPIIAGVITVPGVVYVYTGKVKKAVVYIIGYWAVWAVSLIALVVSVVSGGVFSNMLCTNFSYPYPVINCNSV